MRAALVALALLLAATARGDLVRGTIRVDVRDASAKPVTARVSVRGPNSNAPADEMGVARSGDIYVAAGLVDGAWIIRVEGAGEKQVTVHERQSVGVVFLLGAEAKRGFDPNLAPGERGCDLSDGILVEAVGFARAGGLAAGRVDVRAKGHLVCSAVIAGGAASLHLSAGDYDIAARFVGGGAARERYRVRRNETPTPLVLRAR
jgi:hypothetical protein